MLSSLFPSFTPSELMERVRSKKYEQLLAADYAKAPTIEQLPPAWQEKIEAVRQASLDDIVQYQKAHKRAREAAPAKNDALEQSKADNSPKIKGWSNKLAMQQARYAIENRLAQVFGRELLQSCYDNNPAALLNETSHLHNEKEVVHFILGLLLPIESQPLLSRISGPFRHIQTNRKKETSKQALAALYQLERDEENLQQQQNLQRRSRLQSLDTSCENRDPNNTTISLSDTVNGIWTEATRPRLKQSIKPQALPHIFSIIEEMVHTPYSPIMPRNMPEVGSPWVEKIEKTAVHNVGQSMPD